VHIDAAHFLDYSAVWSGTNTGTTRFNSAGLDVPDNRDRAANADDVGAHGSLAV
jgi:hypothetical protein